MADVSVDALQKVKSALSTFQSDIAGISLRASNQSQNCLNACRQKVDETQAKIEELESAITKLNNKIETLDGQISSALSQIQQLENAIPQIQIYSFRFTESIRLFYLQYISVIFLHDDLHFTVATVIRICTNSIPAFNNAVLNMSIISQIYIV